MANKIKGLINMVYISDVPKVFSKNRETTFKSESLVLYTSPHEHQMIKIKDLLGRGEKNILPIKIDESILKLSYKPLNNYIYGITPFYLCVGDEIKISTNNESVFVEIMNHDGFPLSDWEKDVEKLENNYLHNWSEYLTRSFCPSLLSGKTLNKDQMIQRILEVKTKLRNRIKKTRSSNLDTEYIENYIKTKDVKYLIEGFCYE